MNILQVDSSITGEASISRQLTSAIVERLASANPGARIVRRDLAADPLDYFDARTLVSLSAGVQPTGEETDGASDDAFRSVREFLDADVIVVGVPMYNFGIPAQLKTWIDHLALPGATFRYTPTGPEGLAGGRRVILASARGGIYAEGTPQASVEHQESYLKSVFGFFGITDVETVRAEGVRMGEEAAAAAMREARGRIGELVA